MASAGLTRAGSDAHCLRRPKERACVANAASCTLCLAVTPLNMPSTRRHGRAARPGRLAARRTRPVCPAGDAARPMRRPHGPAAWPVPPARPPAPFAGPVRALGRPARTSGLARLLGRPAGPPVGHPGRAARDWSRLDSRARVGLPFVAPAERAGMRCQHGIVHSLGQLASQHPIHQATNLSSVASGRRAPSPRNQC